MGIPFEERQSLFTKKLRTSSVGTMGEVGTGFGLGIVLNYVKLFNGRISVELNVPHGSVFVIELDAFVPQIVSNQLAFKNTTADSSLRN